MILAILSESDQGLGTPASNKFLDDGIKGSDLDRSRNLNGEALNLVEILVLYEARVLIPELAFEHVVVPIVAKHILIIKVGSTTPLYRPQFTASTPQCLDHV